MVRTVLAGLRARPMRLVLSSVAIVLGVAFVAGALVLADAVRVGLREAVADELRGVDVLVRPGRGTAQVDEALLAKVRQVPGVAVAEGRNTISAPLLDAAGRPREEAAQTLAADERLRQAELVAGRWATGDREAMATAAVGRRVGDVLRVLDEQGREVEFTLVGLFSRDSDSGLGNARLLLPVEAQRRLTAKVGQLVVHARDGVSASRLAEEVRKVGRGLDVVTGQAYSAQLLRETPPGTGGLTGFFTAFAALAMVVATMVIGNSFTILVAQRTRELALLRCVGAERWQVFAGVLTEAAVVGAVASGVGVFSGYGLAWLAQVLVGDFQDQVHLPFSVRTVLLSVGVGLVVTVLAAVLPARAATRVAPVAALRESGGATDRVRGRRTWRLLATGALACAAVLCAVVAVTAEGPEQGAGFAVAAMVAGLGAVLVLGPLVVGPVVRVLGAVGARLVGQPARLAALNAGHNPRRAAASAAALTIGLAVVSLVTTVAAGVESGQGRGLDEQFRGQFTVTSAVSGTPLPAGVRQALAAVPGVRVAPRETFNGELGRFGAWSMTAVPGDAVGDLLRPVVLAGKLDRLGPGEVAIDRQLAEQTGLTVGAQAGRVRVVAVYEGVRAKGVSLAMGVVALDQRPLVDTRGQEGYDSSLLLQAPPDARTALDRALAGFPLAKLTSVAELKDEQAQPFRRTLDLLWGLTALAVLIAFAGIANTLTLSVLERARESALLRALGLTRGGLSATLTAESVFVALFGAGCGLLLGTGSAWLLARVASTEAEPVLFEVPWARLAVVVGAALLAAVLAAVVPARQAGRGSLTAGMAEG
ncbi:FtsX-like permease family protein [Crossiella equi]|nr:ABC transporter permease [Crossiella equi]